MSWCPTTMGRVSCIHDHYIGRFCDGQQQRWVREGGREGGRDYYDQLGTLFLVDIVTLPIESPFYCCMGNATNILTHSLTSGGSGAGCKRFSVFKI